MTAQRHLVISVLLLTYCGLTWAAERRAPRPVARQPTGLGRTQKQILSGLEEYFHELEKSEHEDEPLE